MSRSKCKCGHWALDHFAVFDPGGPKDALGLPVSMHTDGPCGVCVCPYFRVTDVVTDTITISDTECCCYSHEKISRIREIVGSAIWLDPLKTTPELVSEIVAELLAHRKSAINSDVGVW